MIILSIFLIVGGNNQVIVLILAGANLVQERIHLITQG